MDIDQWEAALHTHKGALETARGYELAAGIQAYSHSSEKDWGFWPDNPSVTHKLHLNVLPQHAAAISAFLIERDYEHKFLSGGEIDDGKIFTIYTASLATTLQIVQELLEAHEEQLLPGIAPGERNYDLEGKIVGRFVGEKEHFNRKRCANGMCLLRYSQDIEEAQKKAQELYGDYFSGPSN